MKITIVTPQGMCGGVSAAIKKIERVLSDPKTLKPIYMLGSLVHNKIIVNDFANQGIIVLEGSDKEKILETIKAGTIIFTAHGISDKIYHLAEEKGLNIIDTTCPKVLKTHNIVKEKISKGYNILFWGIKNHPETDGVLGLSEKIKLVTEDTGNFVVHGKTLLINQTTLPYKQVQSFYQKIKTQYPLIELADEVCSATYTRQKAAIEQTKDVDICLVIGDTMSNNCQSLKQVIEKENNVPTFLVEKIEDLEKIDFENINSIAITSGASTPKAIVEAIITKLQSYK